MGRVPSTTKIARRRNDPGPPCSARVRPRPMTTSMSRDAATSASALKAASASMAKYRQITVPKDT